MSALVDKILSDAGIKAPNNELYHYGVVGMRWGIRKDRRTSTVKVKNNKTGKVSEIKYDPNTVKISESGAISATTRGSARDMRKQMAKAAAEPKPEKKSKVTPPPVERPKNTFRNKPDNRRMSDSELRQALSRLQMEKQYKELTTTPKGKNIVKEILADSGKQALRTVAKKGVDVGLQLALEAAARNSSGSTKVFLTAMAATGGKKPKNNK